ncbi:haloacid dehalogenase-like hydrolase [Candidatus Dojkabacteria bacterium]|nr:haloacid dehalogenase-like hydrolase [Candidatus Dojkabacteria bacterium]
MKKLALFDIDGVIYEGHSIFDLVQGWEKDGLIEAGLWDHFLNLLGRYKKGDLTYKEAADNMLLEYSKKLAGKKYEDLVKATYNFISNNMSNLFPYFEKLTPILKETHDIYFVTTNFDFTAEAFSKYFEVNGFLSSKVKQNNGIVNEGVELSLGGNKSIVVDLINKYGFEGSIAVGDSENDADMLEKVEHPFVIEPDEKLKIIAIEKNWIIVDRNNISDTIIKHAK